MPYLLEHEEVVETNAPLHTMISSLRIPHKDPQGIDHGEDDSANEFNV